MRTPDDTYDDRENLFDVKFKREKIAKRGDEGLILNLLDGVLAGIALQNGDPIY